MTKKNEVKIRERLLDLENGLWIWKVHIDFLRERDKNARVMFPHLFERLTANIEKDNRLETLPLVMKKDDRDEFLILSGHHRVRAARSAGLTEIIVLAFEEELTGDEIRSKQLSHNSLNGEDDEQVMREIYAEIENLEERMATGLKNLEEEMDFGTISVDEISVDINYEILNIVFLPKEKEKFDDVVNMIEKKADIVVEEIDSFGPFKNAIREAGGREDIRNISCILSKMADIVTEYYEMKDAEAKEDV